MMRKNIEITKGINNITDLLVLSGRDLGDKQRTKLDIDQLDIDDNKYSIIIPKNIVSVNTSFFLGAFGKSVRYFKSKENFLEKYEFICHENAFLTITDGITDALNNIDVLG